MAGDLRYAQEKLHAVVATLATSHGTLQDRLINAMESQGDRIDPGQSGLGPPIPDELRRRMRTVLDRTRAVQPLHGQESAYKATMKAMSDDEAQEVATQLVELAYLVDLELSD